MTSDGWTGVSAAEPCPACGKGDWCAWSPTGNLRCMRKGKTPPGMRPVGEDSDGGTIFVPDDDTTHNPNAVRSRGSKPAPKASRDAKPATPRELDALHARFRSQAAPERLQELAESTHVSAEGWATVEPGVATAKDLRELGAGFATKKADGADGTDVPRDRADYPAYAWTFPERDGAGRIVGFSLRAPDGRKGAFRGMSRGLIVPTTLHDRSGRVLIVEGASDVAAAHDLGIRAVGRPSNAQGAEELVRLLDGIPAFVVGEYDPKPGGRWPGRDGAKAVAEAMASLGLCGVQWGTMPHGAKDVRRWLESQGADSASTLWTALDETTRTPEAAVEKPKERRPSTVDVLVEMALTLFRLGRSENGEAFAVAKDGPNVAVSLRGNASGLRAKLSRLHRETYGKTPNAQALADALTCLEGYASDAEAEKVALRVAMPDERTIVVDRGDATGSAILIDATGYRRVDRSPVLFRRNGLVGALPEAIEGATPADLLALRDLLNVSDEGWRFVVGWLVASFFPEIAHPVALWSGEQGTGKTTAARIVGALIDPAATGRLPGRTTTAPKHERDWATAADSQYVICLDNVSAIPDWLSDAICKAVTGDVWIARALFTDGEPTCKEFRRCIMLTSIDAGSLRGDLTERLIRFDLERIDGAKRRTDGELATPFAEKAPQILGGLYATVAKVLATLPTVRPERLPRMADFAKILAALDVACPELTDGLALANYLAQAERMQADLIDGDAFAEAIVRLADVPDGWIGSASDLLAAVAPLDRPNAHGWPKSARSIGHYLKRLAPALRAVGVEATQGKTSDRSRTRTWTIRRTANEAGENVRNVQIVPTSECDGVRGGRSADVPGISADVSRPEHRTPDRGGDVPDDADVSSPAPYVGDDWEEGTL